MSGDFFKSLLIPVAVLSAAGIFGFYLASDNNNSNGFSLSFFSSSLSKEKLAQQIGNTPLPTKIEYGESNPISVGGKPYKAEYTIDPYIQQSLAQLLKKGGAKYGALVALEPETGRVVAMISHGMPEENLAVRATFPAASIFKLITAAAAIETGKLQHNSLLSYRGSFHTLYKQNVLFSKTLDSNENHHRRFARFISFQDAFAKSVNSVFGRVGLFGVGPVQLRKMAEQFGFGLPIPFEQPIEISEALIPEEGFALAESASGFTRMNTLSPLHGALIAASIINNGVVYEPTYIQKISDADGSSIYQSEPKILSKILNPQVAKQLQLMMNRTTTNGTSRRSFLGLTRAPALSDLFVGGKTGTLNGQNPKGHYDWFVGFGEKENSKLAIAVLSIHGERYGVKSAYIARKAIEMYFRPTVAINETSRALANGRTSD